MRISRAGRSYETLRALRNRLQLAYLRLPKVHPTSSIHHSARVSRDLVAEEYVFVGRDCEIGPLTRIGRYSMLASGVAVVGDDHVSDVPGLPMQFTGRPPQRQTLIARDVWVGRNAIVLRGVTLGEGAIVAAGAVVTKDVEPYTVVAGVPARKVGNRFQNEDDVQRHHRRLNEKIIESSFADELSRVAKKGGVI